MPYQVTSSGRFDYHYFAATGRKAKSLPIFSFYKIDIAIHIPPIKQKAPKFDCAISMKSLNFEVTDIIIFTVCNFIVSSTESMQVLHLPFRVFLRFCFVLSSIDLTVCIYSVLFLPFTEVVTPGDFI